MPQKNSDVSALLAAARHPADLCGQHYDLAGNRVGFHQILCLAEVLERHRTIDHRLNQAALDEAHRLDQLTLVAQVRAEIILLLVPQEPDIHVSVEAGGGAAGDDRAAPFQTLHRKRPGVGPGVFEYDIRAASVGNAANLGEDVVASAVEH